MDETGSADSGTHTTPFARRVVLVLVTLSAGLLATACASSMQQAVTSPGHATSATTSAHAAHRHRPGRVYATTRRIGSRSGTAERELTLMLARARGRAPMTGYSRDQFGPAWTDDTNAPWGHDGCDTRDEILRRDLNHVVLAADGCTVESGVLHDPYTGKVIDFTRGVGTSEAVQVDHVAALGDDWQTGAQKLSYARREALANDPLNLIAVDGPTNEAKGDGDAATWLPPNTAFRCDYVARQLAVKAKYGLWTTRAEADAMGRVLARCPKENLPTEATAMRRTYGGGPATPVVSSTPTPPSQVFSVSSGSGGGVYYPNCDAARAAGVAPLHRGQPGYRPALDANHDGIACS